MSKTKSLKVNAGLNFLRTFLSLLFPLITFPYASRILSPDGIGKVNFANSIVQYFSIAAALGISTYGIRESAKLRDEKILLSQFVKEILVINMVSTVFAYILFFSSLFIVPKFSSYRILLMVCSTSILFQTLGVDWFYSGLEEYTYITIRSVVFQVLSIVLLFAFVRTENDFIKYAGIGVFSSVGSGLCNFIHLRKYITLKTFLPIKLKKHLSFIFSFFALTVITSVYTVLDTLMLGFLCGDREVGLYTVATKINRIVIALITSVSAVLLPRLSYYVKSDDKEEFSFLTKKSFLILLIFGIPCVCVLFFWGDVFIDLFCGLGYMESFLPMRIMTPIILLIGISNLVGTQIFVPLGKEKLTLYSTILGAAVNFSLNLILIPRYSVIGAAVATLCAETVVTVTQLFFLATLHCTKPRFLL